MGIKNLINKIVFKFKKKEVPRKIIIETEDSLPAAKLEQLLVWLQNNGFAPVTKCAGIGPIQVKVAEPLKAEEMTGERTPVEEPKQTVEESTELIAAQKRLADAELELARAHEEVEK